MPRRGFRVQNPGDVSKYTRSLLPGGLWSGLYGFNWKLYLMHETKGIWREDALVELIFYSLRSWAHGHKTLTCYFFVDVGPDRALNWPIYYLDSMQYCSIANCCWCDAEWNSHCCRANYCQPLHGMHHQNDPSDCRPPYGNWANASSMFSPYTNRTFHDIYTLDAFHFVRATVREGERGRKRWKTF